MIYKARYTSIEDCLKELTSIDRVVNNIRGNLNNDNVKVQKIGIVLANELIKAFFLAMDSIENKIIEASENE